MKKVFLPLVIVLSCANATFAQLNFRPFVGLNSSSITDLDSANFKSKVGYQVGADLQIGNKLYIQPGIQFEFANNRIRPKLLQESDYRRTNLRIPVMVGYSFGGINANWAIRVFTGPNATFNLSNESEVESAFDDLDLKNIIWGWNAGAGVDLLSILFADLGYQVGLSDVFKDVRASHRNNLFYANAGLRIRF